MRLSVFFVGFVFRGGKKSWRLNVIGDFYSKIVFVMCYMF